MKYKFLTLLFAFTLLNQSLQCKVYDCFIFFNELDLLEIRLNELYDVVDKFVLVEAEETFQGKPKPLYFEENKQRFAPYLDKIIHVIVKEKIEGENPWIREIFHRNQVVRGLTDCKDDDIIIMSDADELIRASSIDIITNELLKNNRTNVMCQQTLYRYYLNCNDLTSGWAGTCATTFKNLSTTTPDNHRNHRQSEGSLRNPGKFLYFLIKDAGWHFTSLGGREALEKKYAAYSHTEHNSEEFKNQKYIDNYITNECRIVPIDSTYPKMIIKNLKFYEDHGYIHK